jgi:multiple sugar transport system substrate-binding protein/sn-glycerol 3-phosphate transport system substrate-binding protein
MIGHRFKSLPLLSILLVLLTMLAACGGEGAATTGPSGGGSVATATTGTTTTTTTTTTTAAAAGTTARAASPTTAGAAPRATTSPATAGPANYGFRPGAGSPVDQVSISSPVEVTLWHTQTGPQEAKLKQIIADFEAKNPNIKIRAELQDGYTNLFKKVSSAIQGGGLPELAVSYESMVSEYQLANVVAPLENYINSQKYGLTAEDLADFYPLYITSNQYPEFGGQMLSFPFTKSVLVMYYNADKLKEAGLEVPKTWDQFAAACKRFTGDTKGYAMRIDASTFNGAVYSRGGKLISDDQKRWQFGEQAGQEYLSLIQDLVKSGCAYIPEGRNADQQAFAQGQAIFTMGSSSGLPFYQRAVNEGAKFNWNVAMIPQGSATGTPVTTSYGANIAMFNKSTPEKQLAAWLFVKYFTTTEVNADWSTASGYLPVRKSAANTDVVKQQFERLPAYRVAVTEIQQYARPETTVKGTQDTRTFIEDAWRQAVEDPNRRARDILNEAVQKGNDALQQR